jgi:signal transduction histidine kinase
MDLALVRFACRRGRGRHGGAAEPAHAGPRGPPGAEPAGFGGLRRGWRRHGDRCTASRWSCSRASVRRLTSARCESAIRAHRRRCRPPVAKGRQGTEVLRSAVALPELGWWMVVESPSSVVMAPVWSTVRRIAIFLALGVALAMAAALWLAGRLTRPIRRMHRAVERLARRPARHHHRNPQRGRTGRPGHAVQRHGASLRASVTDLEERIAARTLDLERANRHKSEFLAHMSHELRTPLNAILGFADVLREGMAGPLSDEQREYIGDIHASGMHLLSLINDVLDLAKIEAGQLALVRADFDVAETVAGAAALVRQRCLAKGLSLATQLEPVAKRLECRCPPLQADLAQPVEQRREVHAIGGAHQPARRPGSGRRPVDRGGRQRHRHRRSGP